MRPVAGLGALLVASAGCAAALKEPPPVSTLHRGAGVDPGAAPAEELLGAGRAAYGHRPDVVAVTRSADLCLAAAQADETGPTGVAGLACAIRSGTWLVEHEKDSKVRTDLAVRAVQAGQWCLRRGPDSAPCKFWLAVALGLQARERPATAEDALRRIVPLLREAGRAEPTLDEAGPARVLAILLLRAPGWPLGPGDAEEGLALARQAAALRPDYPPNQLALAEALARNGEVAAGRKAAENALALARAAAAAGEPDAPDWTREAEAKLRR